MPFYHRRWDEDRGDTHDEWGRALYYFWVRDGAVEQQVERYESGVMLAYDRYPQEDEFGFLTTEPLDPAEWQDFEIDMETPLAGS